MTKKILITTGGLSSVGQGGGISSYAHDLAENLAVAGNLVTVFLIKEGRNNSPKNINYQYEFFEIGSTLKKEEEAVMKIKTNIEKLAPDIIINNDTSYLSGLWPVLPKEILKISVMHAFSKGLTLGNTGIMGRIATLNHKFLDYIVCQNSQMIIDVAEKYKIPKEKLIFIPQTAEHVDFEYKADNEIFTITFGGGENKRKGANEMFELSKLLKNSTLTFKVNWCLNADQYSSHFSNDQRFHFLGNLSRDEFIATLKSSDCIVIPTHLDTGPMLLVEAMGQAVIPVCNNLQESAIPDLISNGESGILINNNDPQLFYKEISKLITDPKYRVRLKVKADEYFRQNLTKKAQVERFEKLFRNKKTFLPKEKFCNNNIIYYHRKKTSHLPKYNFKRIKSKIINALEIPQYKH
ncbi:MAG: glycosyltransferase family 4 protein [Flavobacteriales bacterium]|nr:glycosyltransferase family 4 protein [Flavobacteriales bacterium]